MKVIFKIIGVLVVLVIIAMIALPFIVEKNIDTIVRSSIQDRVNAKVDYSDISLSLIKDFPKASLSLQDLKIITNAPFENDTLVYAKQVDLSLSFMQLFNKANEGFSIDKLRLNQAVVKAIVNGKGVANYDIAIKDTSAEEVKEDEATENSADLKLNLDYEIIDSRIVYSDSVAKTFVEFKNLSHSGKGNLSSVVSELNTSTKTDFSFGMGGVTYAKSMPISLEAVIGMDQSTQKYTFLNNEAKLNQIPLVFTGWVQLLEDGTDMDISFKSEKAAFKDLLASIPSAFKKDISGVSANGKFDLHGTVKGKSTDNLIPMLDVSLLTSNASFKYPDLPKGIEDITINATVKNTTGNTDDTYVDLNSFKMKIDEDRFSASGNFSNLSKNLQGNVKADGVINLANLNKAYPVSLDTNLTGTIKANIQTKFDMASIEKEAYDNIKSEGILQLSDFSIKTEELPNQVDISSAKVNFKTNVVKLEQFAMKTGVSDLSATGTLENLIPFIMSDKVLKGDFVLNATNFKVEDFMAEADESAEVPTDDKPNETSEAEETTEGLIPSFLDITSSFKATKVLYDNLELKNTAGQLAVKDQKAILKNVTTDIFGGQIGLSGEISSQQKVPSFDMSLDMSKLDIAQSFTNFNMIKALTPVASALQGLFSSKMSLKGNLNEDLTPSISSLSGKAQANVLDAKVDTKNNTMLTQLNQKANFLDLDKMNLKDLTANFDFEDGKLKVKPFEFKLKDDIVVTASGGHSFDSSMEYALKLDLPAKYLGSSAGGALSKLSAQDLDNINVPVPITLGGTFKNPKVGMNLKGVMTDLTQRVVANQKTALKEKAKTEITKKVNEQISGKAKDVLGGLLGNKKTTDTTAAAAQKETPKVEDAVKDAAGKVLNSLFKKRK